MSKWRLNGFSTCFQNNSMKTNSDKFHLLLTATDCQGLEVCKEKIENSFCEKLLGTKIDTKLELKDRDETLCKKAS